LTIHSSVSIIQSQSLSLLFAVLSSYLINAVYTGTESSQSFSAIIFSLFLKLPHKTSKKLKIIIERGTPLGSG